MEIKGKVFQVLPLQSGTSANGDWKRQTVIVEYQDGQYTSKVALDNAKKAEEFAKVEVGEEYTFKCNTPTSREYNGRWYTSITCWGWDKSSTDAPVQEVAQTPVPTPVAAEPKAGDDMPF